PIQLFPLLGLALALACSDGVAPTDSVQASLAASGRSAFGFNGNASGFPTGAVRLTGGGSYDPATASNIVPTETSVVSSGGFDCTEPVAQGPLAGCQRDEGVRWDTAQLLASTTFKCTGADAPKVATTGSHTAVLLADFYRAGDGIHESFTAQMIVSDSDLAPEISGTQTLWVQGVGCGLANGHFNGQA
ncbi:MAG TPA: hypothetical protein VK535_09500, partial [Gemmatimonadales bacterium]|nr:hypothetical protein [Gemmatimonadales bacterium]